jgi:hypothetical protein
MQFGNNRASPPDSLELEVSVFGTGFGESVLVHFGEDRWILVDSCRDPETRSPIALEYLSKLGVDISRGIKLIVASHWDDDHIAGISEVFTQAQSAVFACPITLAKPEFEVVVAVMTGTRFVSGGSGADEIFAVLKEIKTREEGGRGYHTARLAEANKILLELDGSSHVRVQALSPSDAEIVSATQRLRTIPIPEEGTPRVRLPRFHSNNASVAISVELHNGELLLLGADLEERGLAGVGWAAVVNEWPHHRGKHRVFKVAHHGSRNGHLDDIWQVLLRENPWAIVTPFKQGGTRLPTRQDCERLLGYTDLGRLAGGRYFTRYRDPDPAVRREIGERTRAARFVTSREGQVRLRKSINTDEDWRCELFGDANIIEASFIARID